MIWEVVLSLTIGCLLWLTSLVSEDDDIVER